MGDRCGPEGAILNPWPREQTVDWAPSAPKEGMRQNQSQSLHPRGQESREADSTEMWVLLEEVAFIELGVLELFL